MPPWLGITRRNRLLDLVVFAAMVLGILAILRFLPQPDPITVSGSARILDGDSLIVDGIEIRLDGVDAPEGAQTCERAGQTWPCGREATINLRNLLRGRIVTCEGRERDAHGRLLATCKVRGAEINRWLVEQGWAECPMAVTLRPSARHGRPGGASGRGNSRTRVIGAKRIPSIDIREGPAGQARRNG